ncbi:MAG: HAD hydrolase-like protein [Deltaproteobacteria bacterium]|nr:HAD hydrolase-like protein [Deltaproteobacteria bacterium]
MMDKKLFLFDCDGVLVDSLSVFEGTVRECLDAIGQPIIRSHEDFLDLFDENFYAAIVQKGVDLQAFMQAAGPILARVNYAEMKPFGGLLPVVAAMSRRHRLVIISSGGAKTIRNQLNHFGFDGCFETILGSDFLLIRLIMWAIPPGISGRQKRRASGRLPSPGGGTAGNGWQRSGRIIWWINHKNC